MELQSKEEKKDKEGIENLFREGPNKDDNY